MNLKRSDPKRKLLIFVAIFTFCIVNNLGAQNFPFREYGVQDGLPQSQTTTIFQDARGFLWISSRNGLSRFDGIEFKNYFRRDGLPGNYVGMIFEDISHKLWVLSPEGISYYNGRGFDYFKPEIGTGLTFSYLVTIDNMDNFYVLAQSRILKFNNGIYSDYTSQYKSLDTLKVKNIWFDRRNDELLILDVRGHFWSWKNESLELLTSGKFDYLYSDNNLVFLILNDDIFEYKDRQIKSVSELNKRDQPAISRLVYGNLRIIDYNNGEKVSRIPVPAVVSGNLIDKEGNLWFASEDNIFRLLSTAFTFYTGDDIGIKNIWALAEDRNGHLWFGSLFNNLVEFDGVTFRERNEYKKLFKRSLSFYKGSRRMSNGDEWFSTSNGVLIYDGSTFSRLKNIPEDTQICYIYEDPDNRTAMLGTDKGLFVIGKGGVSLFPEFNDNDLGVIEGITKDDEGIYWLSGHKGVLRFDGLNSKPVKEEILPLAFTYTIEKDSFGGIWVTSEEGLFIKRIRSDVFLAGLPNSINRAANSISIMDSTHILVGRTSDICIIDLTKFYRNDKDYFRIYDKSDGFMGNDCIDNGIIKDKQGRYWILTSDKVVIFEPSNLRTNRHPPELQITGFYYQTDSLAWKEIGDVPLYYNVPENIELSRFQNKLQITFTGISTTNPDKVKLQYRLSGLDEKWSDPSDRRSVFYEKLSPGHYIFQVKGMNADGVENTEPLNLKFRILPAFWQTTLFIIVAALLILASVLLFPLFILKKLHDKKNERERLKSELSHLQMSSVLRQFDTHFTFNVISSVGSLIMRGEKEVAYDYITKLSGLLRTVLSDGSLIIKPLSVELDFVRKYCDLQKLRFKGRFNYSINIDHNIDLERVIPKMTIQTFVENSIKHGFENRKEGGRVDIEIHHNEEKIEIRVVDNGIGRMAASEMNSGGTGNGLKIISGLFQAMNENNLTKSKVEIIDLEDRNGPSGTEVKITIPDNYSFEFVPH